MAVTFQKTRHLFRICAILSAFNIYSQPCKHYLGTAAVAFSHSYQQGARVSSQDEPLLWLHHVVMKRFCPQHNTMESLLQRGEKLDDLVAKSEHLSTHSRVFYKNVSAHSLLPPTLFCCELEFIS